VNRYDLHLVHRYITSVNLLSYYIKDITITSNSGVVYFTLETLLLFLEFGFSHLHLEYNWFFWVVSSVTRVIVHL